MANFRETFYNKHAILPVIHVESEKQAEENTKIAKDLGCDGVFLIDMNLRGYQRLIEIYRFVREKNPDFWIGLNCLDLPASAVFSLIPKEVSGVWVDNAEITESDMQIRAMIINKVRTNSAWNGLYFGGVAFKYQEPVRDLAKVSQTAKDYMDVVTTSGSGTGHAADINKIKIMKNSLGDKPLAIASGISPENVSDYLEISDCYLVATSLLVPGTNDFNPKKVAALVKNIR